MSRRSMSMSIRSWAMRHITAMRGLRTATAGEFTVRSTTPDMTRGSTEDGTEDIMTRGSTIHIGTEDGTDGGTEDGMEDGTIRGTVHGITTAAGMTVIGITIILTLGLTGRRSDTAVLRYTTVQGA